LALLKEYLPKSGPTYKEYGEAEAKKLAQALVMIEALKVSGKINKDQARLHLEIQKNSARIVLLALEGFGILAVEAALNAALDVVKQAVNTAVGFALI
jgi:hypothetical protein